MNNFLTITAKLKTILSQMHHAKIHDKDVAITLGITPSTFASMKRRNTIPYRAILDFCALHHINANALLFNRPVNNLIKEPVTLKYYDENGTGSYILLVDLFWFGGALYFTKKNVEIVKS